MDPLFQFDEELEFTAPYEPRGLTEQSSLLAKVTSASSFSLKSSGELAKSVERKVGNFNRSSSSPVRFDTGDQEICLFGSQTAGPELGSSRYDLISLAGQIKQTAEKKLLPTPY